MKPRKKVSIIFSLIMLATNITLATTNYHTLSLQENSSSRIQSAKPKARRLAMKENCMHLKQKSASISPFVVQFNDKLSVSYSTSSNYTILVTDINEQILYTQFVSGSKPYPTYINLVGYQEGWYTIKLIISEDEYSYGEFVID